MKSKYFIDIDEAMDFVAYLEFMGVKYITFFHNQTCSKYNVNYTVYEVKYCEGDNDVL